jgi:hypothetical protein
MSRCSQRSAIGDIRARSAQPPAESHDRTRRHVDGRSQIDRTIVDGDFEDRPRHRHRPGVVEFEFGAGDGHFERRGVGVVAGERIREPVRIHIHRS